MKEPCKAMQKAQAIKPHLKSCPGEETRVVRHLSGHGSKVCEACKKKNRDEQRKRENAQKRARRAKLKRDKMTAGIGKGNVVWTSPSVWTPSVVDAPTLALHSPQPRRPFTFKVRSTTQALQYALNGSISIATMMQNDIDVSQREHGVYSESRQMVVATTSNLLQPANDCLDEMVTEVCDATNSRHLHEDEPQDLPSKLLDEPFCEEQKRQPVGLGITIPSDHQQDHDHTEPCSFSEWSFRMELNKWSTVFDDDDPDDAKAI